MRAAYIYVRTVTTITIILLIAAGPSVHPVDDTITFELSQNKWGKSFILPYIFFVNFFFFRFPVPGSARVRKSTSVESRAPRRTKRIFFYRTRCRRVVLTRLIVSRNTTGISLVFYFFFYNGFACVFFFHSFFESPIRFWQKRIKGTEKKKTVT